MNNGKRLEFKNGLSSFNRNIDNNEIGFTGKAIELFFRIVFICSIEDGNRGILLQQKIEDVVKLNPKVKVYFSSPFTSNPEILFENVNTLGKKEKVNTLFVAVNQNLIYIQQRARQPSAPHVLMGKNLAYIAPVNV